MEKEGRGGESWSRRRSPRLCGWLREVSFRATSPAAAARYGVAEIGRALPQPALVRVAVRGQLSGHLVSGGAVRGSDEEVEAVAQACWGGRGVMRGEGRGMVQETEENDFRGMVGVMGRPSIGGATKVTPELGVGNPLNKEPHNGPSAERTWSMQWR